MEQDITEEMQNLCLTKEEEEDIIITAQNRDDLLEECSLSLFGRLLSDRQQNMRALKNTLRAAWKMGSELRIVDVGGNILQFKFGSSYQRDWVENSGPWNFENNLLLLCRWKKGLTATNIVFTHTPFWIQLWGLPFELMSEEVCQDIGKSLGRLIEVDRRAKHQDQAKFLRIRVDLPIEKPLRRGGNVVNKNGEKFWITFRYERLPTFCYLCGLLGHDDKHCKSYSDWQNTPKQYGEWLKANGAFNGGEVKKMNFKVRNSGASANESGNRSRSAAENLLHTSPEGCGEESNNEDSSQSSKSWDKSTQSQICGVSNTQDRQPAKVRAERDISGIEMGVVGQKAEAEAERPTPILIDEPNPDFEVHERSMMQDSCLPTPHVESYKEDTRPLTIRHWAQKQEEKAAQAAQKQDEREKQEAQKQEERIEQAAAHETKERQRGRGRIKSIAREKGLAQRKEKQALGPSSGTKRQINLLLSEKKMENLDSSAKKRKDGSIVCMKHDVHHNENISIYSVSDTNEAQNDNVLNVHCVNLGANVEPDISAVAAVQHRRKP